MKNHLIFIVFSLILIGTNWFSTKNYDLPAGMSGRTEESFTPVALGLILCLIVILYFGRRAYSVIRDILDKEIRIKREIEIFSLWPAIYLIPLFFHRHQTFASTLEDGTKMTHSYGFGTDAGSLLFFLGVVSFLLFQFVYKIEPLIKQKENKTLGENSEPLRDSESSS